MVYGELMICNKYGAYTDQVLLKVKKDWINQIYTYGIYPPPPPGYTLPTLRQFLGLQNRTQATAWVLPNALWYIYIYNYLYSANYTLFMHESYTDHKYTIYTGHKYTIYTGHKYTIYTGRNYRT